MTLADLRCFPEMTSCKDFEYDPDLAFHVSFLREKLPTVLDPTDGMWKLGINSKKSILFQIFL